MASWSDVERDAPELATVVLARFTTRKHHTLATLRRDGSPRISGTEIEFSDGNLWIGSMPAAVKARDLQRDPRFALHSATVDPPADDPSGWPGEAKVAGRAIEVSDPGATGEPHRFRLDVAEVVFTRVEGNELVIDSWSADRGFVRRRRT